MKKNIFIYFNGILGLFYLFRSCMPKKKQLFFLIFITLLYMPLQMKAQSSTQDSLLSLAQESFNEGKYKVTVSILSAEIQKDTLSRTISYAKMLLLISDAYARLNDKEKAYQYFEQYIILKDSISLEERENLATQLGIKYETAKKDKVIVEQQLRLKKSEAKNMQKGLLIQGSIYATIILLILCFLSLSNYRKKRRIDQRIKEQIAYKNEIEQLQSNIKGEREERDRIFRQLQTTIYPEIHVAKAMLEDLKKAIPNIHRTVAFCDAHQIICDIETGLDAMLVYSQKEMTGNSYSLQRLFSNFLSNIPNSYPLRVDFECCGTEVMLSRDITVNMLRILQELVQNIIKHSGASTALVTLRYTPGQIALQVRDNGKGWLPEPNHFGIGIHNVKGRLRKLKGEMAITQMNGTTINVVIPVA